MTRVSSSAEGFAVAMPGRFPAEGARGGKEKGGGMHRSPHAAVMIHPEA
jgi:hypothetical protein